MVAIIFWIITCYLLYKFIFGFVVPLVSATRQVRTKMKDMQQNVEDFQKAQNAGNSPTENTSGPYSFKPNASKGDYIDFEEIK